LHNNYISFLLYFPLKSHKIIIYLNLELIMEKSKNTEPAPKSQKQP